MGGFLVWSYMALVAIICVVWCVWPFVFMFHVLRKEKKNKKEHPEWYKDCKPADYVDMSGDDSWYDLF